MHYQHRLITEQHASLIVQYQRRLITELTHASAYNGAEACMMHHIVIELKYQHEHRLITTCS